jgi:1-deoxy-D-xylulose-5-phosphate synthase
MIDRAGLAPSDGATHHGIFDVSFLSHIPEVSLYAPASYSMLKRALAISNGARSPIAVRYPNAAEHDFVDREFNEFSSDQAPFLRVDFSLDKIPEVILITYGNIVGEVRRAKMLLAEKGVFTGIILVECIKPYRPVCERVYEIVSSVKQVLYVEEGIKNGGAAMITETLLAEMGLDLRKTRYDIAAIDDNFASPSKPANIYDYAGLSAEKICEKIKYLF